MNTFWCIHFTLPASAIHEIEEHSALCIARGASGADISKPNSIDCYFTGSSDALSSFISEIEPQLGKPASIEEIKKSNWVAESRDSWAPIPIGKLTILPSLDPDEITSAPLEWQIKIVPGLGFGTGEHATTAMIIQLLQHKLLSSIKIRHMLDVGTGSGILALAGASLFKSEVFAIDNDPLAIENAQTAVALNPSLSGLIHISCCEINAVPTRPYQLITANLYAELLLELKSSLYSLLEAQGFLVLSGIVEDLSIQVKDEYCGVLGMSLCAEMSNKGWSALLLTKPR